VRILVSLVVALTLVMFSLLVGGVSALSEDPVDAPIEAPAEPAGEGQAFEEDPVDAPIEAPAEPAGEGQAFEDGETGKIDGCEGEIYSTPEAAAEAAEAKGTDFHEHQKAGTTYYMLG